jgi:hypothetical protein
VDRRQLDAARDALTSLPAPRQLTGWQHELTDLDRRLTAIADSRVRAALHHPPRYLLRTIGTAPPAGPERDRWRDAVRQVERYRTTHGITDPDHPLGAPGIDHDQTRHRRQAARALLEYAPGADLEAPRVRTRGLDRGLSL